MLKFSPMALALLAKTKAAGAMVARQILMDFEENNEDYGPITRSALPLNATTINPKVMGFKSILMLSYNKPKDGPEYVDVTLTGAKGDYTRQALTIRETLPATIVSGFEGRMLSDVTPLPGFETMEIIESQIMTNGGGRFIASPPDVTEHEIDAVLGNEPTEDIGGAAGYTSALDKRTTVIMELLRERIPDIDEFLDPLWEHIFLDREEDKHIRLTHNWSMTAKTAIGLQSYEHKRIDSNAAKENAIKEIVAAIKWAKNR